MTTVFEFISKEPVENVITCMHFKIDKVILFGVHKTIQDGKKPTENFLKKYCGVRKIVFHELPDTNMQSILKTMRTEIQREIVNGSKIYFDLTGGNGLNLVAFGMLSKEFETPMHLYDIPADKLIELDEGASGCISNDIPGQEVELNLDRYIELKGGIINRGLHKSVREDMDEEFIEDIAEIWRIAKKYIDYWNPFSEFIRNNMVPDENLQVNKRAQSVLAALSSSTNKLKQIRTLNSIVDDLEAAGILKDVVHADGKYRFRFKNQRIKECLWESGSILELHVFQKQKKNSTDCRVGVHLDWDGVIHEIPGTDVLNEVDVLSITGNIPTFISCKSGKMAASQTLRALYELDVVAKRFGGKYAKKILVSAQKLGPMYRARAEEMGIEINLF